MHFQYKIKIYFTKNSWFCTCWWSCNDNLMNFLSFYTTVFTLVSFILQWWANASADLNLWYISSDSSFSCSTVTFLCFLRVFPTSLVAFCMVQMVFFKFYSIVLNRMKNTWELQEITFYWDMQFTGKTTVHTEN